MSLARRFRRTSEPGLWDILFRGQLGFSISFLEEMWARNLGNLMMSPLKPIEFLLALMAMSLVRLAIGNAQLRIINKPVS